MAVVEEARRKVDRDEVFLELTRSICPVCKRVIDAEVNIRRQPSDHAQALPGARPVRGPRLLGRGALRGAAALQQAGHVEATERHDEALAALLDRVEARLKLARLAGFGVASGRELVVAAREAVAEGPLGYGVVIARK